MILLLYFLAFSVGANLLMYFLAYLLQTDKLTDISYATTFALLAGVGYYLSERSLVDSLLLLLVGLWALRLGSYLFRRILQIGEDERFEHIRKSPLAFFGFWLVQGVSCAVIALAYLLAFQSSGKLPVPLFWLGLAIAAVGLLLETVADAQKFRFKQQQPKHFMQTGLWRRLRHPNYTGEILFWWGIWLACATYVTPLWLAVISPIWISLLLLRFSGIPPLERAWERKYSSDPSFIAYRAQSWRLFPFIY